MNAKLVFKRKSNWLIFAYQFTQNLAKFSNLINFAHIDFLEKFFVDLEKFFFLSE